MNLTWCPMCIVTHVCTCSTLYKLKCLFVSRAHPKLEFIIKLKSTFMYYICLVTFKNRKGKKSTVPKSVNNYSQQTN